MKNVTSFAKLFILCLGVSCVSKPNRPDSPLCLFNSDGWVCTNSGGDFRSEESNLICTDLSGYAALERYVDELELRIRKLERRCQ